MGNDESGLCGGAFLRCKQVSKASVCQAAYGRWWVAHPRLAFDGLLGYNRTIPNFSGACKGQVASDLNLLPKQWITDAEEYQDAYNQFCTRIGSTNQAKYQCITLQSFHIFHLVYMFDHSHPHCFYYKNTIGVQDDFV